MGFIQNVCYLKLNIYAQALITACVKDVKDFVGHLDLCISVYMCQQIWDRRHAGKPNKQFSVHSGPAYCCSWHPEMSHWIMSAGRDKMIKVSNLLVSQSILTLLTFANGITSAMSMFC